jgi:hypothetical protein
MAYRRKTLNVTEFKDLINRILAQSTDSKEFRRGLQFALQQALDKTDTYRGFRYLTVREVPAGEKPGINIDPKTGEYSDDYEERFADTDRSRVQYC